MFGSYFRLSHFMIFFDTPSGIVFIIYKKELKVIKFYLKTLFSFSKD